MIDLHIHTNCSDGQYAPEETMRMAFAAGITTVAVTDHDTVSGLAVAEKTANELRMQFFSGIEISVQSEREMHILGYGIHAADTALLAFCRKNAENRASRCGRMLTYLKQCGAPITLEEVKRYNEGRTTGRPHFAKTLVKKGYAVSIQDAFDRYLTTPEFYAHVERPKPSPEEGIQIIRSAGGVAVLAHPYQLHLDENDMDILLAKLKAIGLQGIEAYYSWHTPQQTQMFLALAKKHGLFVTCGSDFHGEAVKPDIALGTGVANSLSISDMSIPRCLLKAIVTGKEFGA